MSFYFRDKPKFSDRLRGKSGDELLEEIKQQFDEDSKSFFEPSTRSGRDPFERHSAFSRAFPFDDEGFGRRSDIRAHLDDLAARHPEFADHLLGPPWGDIPFQSSFRNRNHHHHHRGSGNGYQQQGYSDEDARSQASGSSATSGASVGSHGEPESGQSQQPDHRSHDSEHTSKKNQIPQYGLRNTVDIGQHHHNMENPEKGNRGQRSMSAPPENRQSTNQQQQPRQEQSTQQHPQGQRYVSRIDITPQHNQPPQHQQQQPQPQQQQPQQQQPQPQQQQQQSQKPQQQQGNVRHIPIFVEGRDEPVLPRSFDEQSNFRREPSPTQFHAPPPHFQRSSPFGDVFAGRHQWSPHFQDTFYQQPTTAFEHPSRRQQQQQPQSFQQPRKAQQQNYEQAKSQQKPQQQQQPQQQSQQQPQQQQQEPPPRPKPSVPKDPLERVALIQKEIDSLAEQVKQYNGNSRTDKQYIYLDEMLTRQLIKLDDIETEGRDNVRQARKNAIKTIQETISLLESKAPLPSQQTPSNEQEEQDKQLSNDAEKSGQSIDSMDIDQRPEDQVSTNDVEKTTGQPDTTEADRKTAEIQSKEPIPLPPPCPSSEEKSTENSEQSCTGVTTDHWAREMDVTPNQTSSEPMDTTAPAEKSKPTDHPQQTTSTTEEKKVVEDEKPPSTVVDDERTSKKPEHETEQRKSDKGNAKKNDTSEEKNEEEKNEEKKKQETENKKQFTQEEQRQQKGDEKMDVDSEVKQSPKTQKKGKKTKKQQTTAASDKPIPLPAPESTEASTK